MQIDMFLRIHGVSLMENGWDSKKGVLSKEFAKAAPGLGHFDFAENVENVIGKRVWICDYRNGKTALGRPVRSIAPMLVKVLDAAEADKTICYSPIFFKQIKKDGTLCAAEISPFDNAGFGNSTGVSVNIFENREDCVKCYIEQLEKAISEKKPLLEECQQECDSLQEEVDRFIRDTAQ